VRSGGCEPAPVGRSRKVQAEARLTSALTAYECDLYQAKHYKAPLKPGEFFPETAGVKTLTESHNTLVCLKTMREALKKYVAPNQGIKIKRTQVQEIGACLEHQQHLQGL